MVSAVVGKVAVEGATGSLEDRDVCSLEGLGSLIHQVVDRCSPLGYTNMEQVATVVVGMWVNLVRKRSSTVLVHRVTFMMRRGPIVAPGFWELCDEDV